MKPLKHYVAYTADGFTSDMKDNPTENLQILGFVTANSVSDAFAMLVKDLSAHGPFPAYSEVTVREIGRKFESYYLEYEEPTENASAIGRNGCRMRECINGRWFDTDSAEQLGVWDSGHPMTKSAASVGTLFRDNFGTYFLHLWTGPYSASKKGRKNERIIPFDEETARKWVSLFLSGKDYELIFGDRAGCDGSASKALC